MPSTMSTPEEIDLQLLHKDGEVASGSEEQKPLEQPKAVKGAVYQVTTTRSRVKKILLCVLTLLSYLCVFAGMSSVTAFYAIVAQNHNVPTYVSGFVLGVPNLILAVLAPFIGYFLPHLGLKFTQVAGLFLTAGSQLLFGFVSKMPNRTLFITFSFLLKFWEGIGLTMFATASLTVLTQLFLQRKGTLAGILEFAISLGYVIGVPLGGGLQEVGGFVLPLLVYGGCGLFLALLLLVNVHPTECTSVKLPWRTALKLFKNIFFILLVLSPIIALGTLYSFNAFFGQFLNTQFHLSVGIIGVIYLSGLVMDTLAAVSAGPLSDKLKIPRYLLVGGLVVGAAGCVFIGPAGFITTPKLWLSILSWVVFETGIMFAVVPTYPALFEAIKNLHVEEAVLVSTLSGILAASYALGAFLGPVAGGVLVHRVGFPSMAAISGGILLAYALVLVVMTVIEKIWKRKMNGKKIKG